MQRITKIFYALMKFLFEFIILTSVVWQSVEVLRENVMLRHHRLGPSRVEER